MDLTTNNDTSKLVDAFWAQNKINIINHGERASISLYFDGWFLLFFFDGIWVAVKLMLGSLSDSHIKGGKTYTVDVDSHQDGGFFSPFISSLYLHYSRLVFFPFSPWQLPLHQVFSPQLINPRYCWFSIKTTVSHTVWENKTTNSKMREMMIICPSHVLVEYFQFSVNDV